MHKDLLKKEFFGVLEASKEAQERLDTLLRRLKPVDADLETADVGGTFCRTFLLVLEDLKSLREDLDGLEKVIQDSLGRYIHDEQSFRSP